MPEEKGDVQDKKRETLKDALQYGKAHLLLGKKGKWSTENIDRKTDEECRKRLYNMYMQWQIKLKGEMTGRTMGRQLNQSIFKWRM